MYRICLLYFENHFLLKAGGIFPYVPGFAFLHKLITCYLKLVLLAYMLYVSPTKMNSRNFVMFPDIHDTYNNTWHTAGTQ